MWLDGRDVTGLSLDARRQLLSDLPLEPPLRRVTLLEDARPWERACREGWEGVIAKRRDSRYEHRRSPHWLKMKCEASQELVVGGFTDPQGSRVGLGALLVGYFDGDDFVFAGKLGTGFDTALLRELRAKLDALEVPTPRSRRAKDCHGSARTGSGRRSSCRRRFIEWTVHGKLRHPRFLGRAYRQVGPRGRPGDAVITHPDKVLFPDDGITKGELAAYYEAIAPLMLPHVRDRPITMERFPNGIGEKGFIQKDVSKGFPEWLERVEVPKKDGTVHHALVTDTRSLLWIVNQNCITPHVWVVARAGPLQPGCLRVRSRSATRRSAGCSEKGRARRSGSARRARPAKLGQDVRIEGLSHPGLARRQDPHRRRRAIRAPGRRVAGRSAIRNT